MNVKMGNAVSDTPKPETFNSTTDEHGWTRIQQWKRAPSGAMTGGRWNDLTIEAGFTFGGVNKITW
jgi:hypothetical protein